MKTKCCLTIAVAVIVAGALFAEGEERQASGGGDGVGAKLGKFVEGVMENFDEAVREDGKNREWRFGGTFALSSGTMQPGGARMDGSLPEEGFVGEYAVHGRVRTGEHVQGSVRACYGCHGLELETATLSIYFSGLLTLQAGRFHAPVGASEAHHDQAARHTVTRPLTHIMGNMVRGKEFNQGVLPAPLVDNGVQAKGFLYSGKDRAAIAYSAFLVRGLKGFTTDADFIVSRDFDDNNGEPAWGGRLSAELFTNDLDLISFGASYMQGNYDAAGDLSYRVWGLDAEVAFNFFSSDVGPNMHRALTLSGEALWRTTEYTSGGATDDYLKRSHRVQAAYKLDHQIHLVAAWDQMTVSGIALGPAGPTTIAALMLTDKRNIIDRFTGGVTMDIGEGVLLKAGMEYWDFSDFPDVWVFQGAFVWSF